MMTYSCFSLPGNAGKVCQDVVELFFLQLAKRRVLWEDDDGTAILSSTTWTHAHL